MIPKDLWVLVALGVVLASVSLAPPSLFAVPGPLSMQPARPMLPPPPAVVSYCREPAPPGVLATFAPCREVIGHSVWPL
ncbi:MAG TPA: hypothetical protein VGC15_06775 [Acetobacteraceae bacterium]